MPKTRQFLKTQIVLVTLLLGWFAGCSIFLNPLKGNYEAVHGFAFLPNKNAEEGPDDVYRRRRNALHSACQTHHVEGKSWMFIMNNKPRMYYCVVPKCGATYWKSIFKFANNETGKHVKYPEELSRGAAHSLSKRVRLSTSEILINQPANSIRFLITRNPYSRLWSAYLDKFYLPDFWKKRFLYDTDCPTNVTFLDFLKFVLRQDPKTTNQHWRPTSYLCDPCRFDPHIIGRQESFRSDAAYILNKAGLGSLVKNNSSHGEHEIWLVSEATFNDETARKCMTSGQIAVRLWTVFQLNGYISLNDSFPGDQDPDIHLNEFITIAQQFQRKSSNRINESDQRRISLLNAYKSIPDEILRDLQKYYRNDFLLFSYDPTPPGRQLFNSSPILN